MADFNPTGPGFYARSGHFAIRFTNGWRVSVYFRSGGYCENYDVRVEGISSYECLNAEVKIESPDENLKTVWDFLRSIKDLNWVYDHAQGCGIVGYVEPEEVVDILTAVAAIKEAN